MNRASGNVASEERDVDHVHRGLLRVAAFPVPLRVQPEDLADRLGVLVVSASIRRVRTDPHPGPIAGTRSGSRGRRRTARRRSRPRASYRRRRRPIVTRKWDSGGTAIWGCESNIARSSVVPDLPRATMKGKGRLSSRRALPLPAGSLRWALIASRLAPTWWKRSVLARGLDRAGTIHRTIRSPTSTAPSCSEIDSNACIDVLSTRRSSTRCPLLSSAGRS